MSQWKTTRLHSPVLIRSEMEPQIHSTALRFGRDDKLWFGYLGFAFAIGWEENGLHSPNVNAAGRANGIGSLHS